MQFDREGGGIMVCTICIHRLELLPIYDSRVFLVYICMLNMLPYPF